MFSLLAKNHINVDIILQGIGHEEGKDICFTVASGDLERAAELLRANQEEIGFVRLETNSDIAKVSVVGAGMINNPGVAARMFEALYDAGVNINMISTSEIKISVLVDKRDGDRAVQAIHDKFFVCKEAERSPWAGRCGPGTFIMPESVFGMLKISPK